MSTDFMRWQRELAAHLRGSQAGSPPDAPRDERVQIYRDLLYATVEGAISKAFPVLRRISTPQQWHARIRDFYAHAPLRNPLLRGVAEDFVLHVERQTAQPLDDFPFLAELCHYEWVEMALAIAPDDAPAPLTLDAQALGAQTLRRSALAWNLSYRYPVQQISPAYLPQEPPPEATHLIVWRDREHHVRFMQVNPLTSALIAALDDSASQPAKDVLTQLAGHAGIENPQLFITAALDMLGRLGRAGIITTADT